MMEMFNIYLKNSCISFEVAPIHADQDLASHMEILGKLKFGTCHVFIVTNVVSHGLNRSGKLVLNFHIARGMVVHIHKIGRTGSVDDKDGTAYKYLK